MDINPSIRPFAALTERSRQAQERWAAIPVRERVQVVWRLRAALLDAIPSLCAAVEKDLGRPPEQTLPAEIFSIAAGCRFLEKRAHRVLAPRRVEGPPVWLFGQKDWVHRRPRGVVGIIGTWNYPLYLNGVQIMQALVAGNSVLWKPSEVAPHAADALEAWLAKAQLPEGLFVRLPATREAGVQLADADIAHVVFTGHASTGRKLSANVSSVRRWNCPAATLSSSSMMLIWNWPPRPPGSAAPSIAVKPASLSAGPSCHGSIMPSS